MSDEPQFEFVCTKATYMKDGKEQPLPKPWPTFSNPLTTEDTMSDDNKSGRKYFRPIKGEKMLGTERGDAVHIDIYGVIETFDVTCPARQHALKKILLAGDRGKNDTIADLDEARDAITRAIELEEQREAGR